MEPQRSLPLFIDRLFEALEPSPAWLLDRVFNIVAANGASQALWPDLPESPLRSNFLWQLFTEPARRMFDVDWPLVVSSAVAELGGAAQPQVYDSILRMRIADMTLNVRLTYLEVFEAGGYTLCVLSAADRGSRKSLRWHARSATKPDAS